MSHISWKKYQGSLIVSQKQIKLWGEKMNDRRKKGIEKEVARIIGMALLTEIKNEKLKNVLSVHKVEITKDGRYIDLTFSVLDIKNNINKEKIVDDLEKLKGFFRKLIGNQLTLRFVPEVRIHLDDSIEYGIKIASILNEIKQKDSE